MDLKSFLVVCKEKDEGDIVVFIDDVTFDTFDNSPELHEPKDAIDLDTIKAIKDLDLKTLEVLFAQTR